MSESFHTFNTYIFILIPYIFYSSPPYQESSGDKKDALLQRDVNEGNEKRAPLADVEALPDTLQSNDTNGNQQQQQQKTQQQQPSQLKPSATEKGELNSKKDSRASTNLDFLLAILRHKRIASGVR